MAYIVMSYIVMAYIVMAYIAMAAIGTCDPLGRQLSSSDNIVP